MDAPSKGNIKDFNIVGANILSNVKDINTLLSANGNVMDNLFKNSQDKIVKKIKTKIVCVFVYCIFINFFVIFFVSI